MITRRTFVNSVGAGLVGRMLGPEQRQQALARASAAAGLDGQEGQKRQAPRLRQQGLQHPAIRATGVDGAQQPEPDHARITVTGDHAAIPNRTENAHALDC